MARSMLGNSPVIHGVRARMLSTVLRLGGWLFAIVAGCVGASGVCAGQDAPDERIAIVVNIDSPATRVSREELVNLFLGRARQLENGVHIVPLDQMEGSATRVGFYERVLDKSESQMNSYWSRLIFSGKGRPPYAVADDREVLDLIAANRNMLGYVRASSVDAHVKVIQLVP